MVTENLIMYKLIENEESAYMVILKENSIRSEHTGKV